MNEKKTGPVETLRRAIPLEVDAASETDWANDSLIDLSFVSKLHPTRSVWIDLREGADPVVDLEDELANDRWDGLVARLSSSNQAVAIVKSRLTDSILSECIALADQQLPVD